MLSIQPANPQKCTPNLLPTRINHNGPINDTQRYWKPETDDKGTQHVHFRGRHLHGTSIPLPSRYTGAVLSVTDKKLPAQLSQPREEDEDEADEMETEEVKIAEQIGTFESITVWEHGGKVDVERDAYVRGLQEWVGWAESMHCDEEEEEEEEEKVDSGKKEGKKA